MTSKEFELHCMCVLRGYAEEEKLRDFTIEHDVKLTADDGTYQIDVYVKYKALGAEMKILAECKQYSRSVSRDKVEVLASRLRSLGAHKGILMSTAGFQSGAIEFAEKHGIALVQVFDTNEMWYSHSSGPNSVPEDDDPFIYAEKHMPRYVAQLIKTDSTKWIYPSEEFVRSLIDEQNKRIAEQYSLAPYSQSN